MRTHEQVYRVRVRVPIAMAVLTRAPQAPIAVMILDGESGGTYHDWQRVTPVLKKMLDETGLFATTVVTAPPAKGDFTALPRTSRSIRSW